MAKCAVQIGHVNGKAGAAYEEATLKLIFPFVLERIRTAGVQADPFDGTLQFEPANYQYRYDVAVFLHCDAGGTRSTGFSVGFWEEVHPGSKDFAGVLKAVYGKASGLKFIGYNITVGEHHYYGNRRFANNCKCALIEFGFVSNPAERAFLQSNAKKLGYAVGDAVLEYLKIAKPPEKPKEDGMFYQYAGQAFVVEDLYVGKYTYWLHLRNPGAKPAVVELVFIQESDNKRVKAGAFTLKPGEAWREDIGNIAANDPAYKIKGSFALEGLTTEPISWLLREIPK